MSTLAQALPTMERSYVLGQTGLTFHRTLTNAEYEALGLKVAAGSRASDDPTSGVGGEENRGPAPSQDR